MNTTFKDRLVEEHAALNEKIEKLSKFISESDIFKGLSTEHQDLLKLQLFHMSEYQQILIQRIKLLS